MELSDNDIDKLFKDNLSDLNLTFDPKDWNNMQEKIKAKKRRKFILLIALLILVGTLVALFLFNYLGKNNSYSGNNTTNNIENNLNKNNTTNYGIITGKSNKKTGNNSNQTNTNAHSLGENGVVNDSNQNRSNKDTFGEDGAGNETYNKQSIEKIETEASNNDYNIKPISAQNGKPETNNNTSLGTQPKTNSTSLDPKQPESNETSSHQLTSANTEVNKQLEKKNKFDLVLEPKTDSTHSDIQVISNAIHDAQKEIKSSLTSNIEQEEEKSFNQTRLMDKLYILKAELPNFNKKDILHLDTVMIIPEKDTLVENSTWGIEIYPNISGVYNKKELTQTEGSSRIWNGNGSGINFNYTQKINNNLSGLFGVGMESSRFERDFILLREDSGVIQEYEATETASFQYVDLRLGVNYKFGSKKLSCFIHVSGEYNYLLFSRGDLGYNKTENGRTMHHSEVLETNANKNMASINLGIGASLRLGKTWSIYAQPNFKHYLFPYGIGNTMGIDPTPYSYGLKLGLRYHIFKMITLPPRFK